MVLKCYIWKMRSSGKNKSLCSVAPPVRVKQHPQTCFPDSFAVKRTVTLQFQPPLAHPTAWKRRARHTLGFTSYSWMKLQLRECRRSANSCCLLGQFFLVWTNPKQKSQEVFFQKVSVTGILPTGPSKSENSQSNVGWYFSLYCYRVPLPHHTNQVQPLLLWVASVSVSVAWLSGEAEEPTVVWDLLTDRQMRLVWFNEMLQITSCDCLFFVLSISKSRFGVDRKSPKTSKTSLWVLFYPDGWCDTRITTYSSLMRLHSKSCI